MVYQAWMSKVLMPSTCNQVDSVIEGSTDVSVMATMNDIIVLLQHLTFHSVDTTTSIMKWYSKATRNSCFMTLLVLRLAVQMSLRR